MQPAIERSLTAERQLDFPDYSAPRPGSLLSHYFRILWRRKAVFASILTGCLAVAATVNYSTEPSYQSRALLELQVPPSAPLSLQEEGMPRAATGQTYDSYLQTQIGILGSDTLIRKVVDRIHLDELMNRHPATGLVAWRRHYLSFQDDKHADRDSAFTEAKKNLMVRQSRLNNLIEITGSASDPETAALFVNTLADEYSQQNLEARWQMAQQASSWLTRHLTDLRAKLEASENALQDYSRENQLMVVADKSSLQKERLQQLQGELSAAQDVRMHRQSEMPSLTEDSSNSVPEVLDNPVLKEYQIKLADLRLRLTEYKQIYVAGSPKLLSLQAQIASLEGALERQKANVLARFSNQFEAASKKERLLRNAYNAQMKLVATQDEKMIRYGTLKHDADSNRVIYESLLQKVKESGVSLALQAPSVRVVDAAASANSPSKPSKAVNLAVGLLAGLLFGFCTVGLLEHSDRSIRQPGMIPRFLMAPELGFIPTTQLARARPAPASSRWISPVPLLTEGRHKPESEIQAWLDPGSAVGESFRFVMTSLLFAEGLSNSGRLLLITSASPGEGKTTITTNLAAALANTGRRVLIVDADLRRPRLHDVFGVPISPGLLEIADELPSAALRNAAVKKFVRLTSVPKLSLMTSGVWKSSGPHPLHSSVFKETFASLRSEFDIVLVDSSPLLHVPETRMMAHLSDGVILVVRAGTTRVDEVVTAERQLVQDGCNLVGTVLNQAHPSFSRKYARYTEASRIITHA